jgi:hypothetical protein
MTGIQPTSNAFQGLRRMRRDADAVMMGALAGFRLIGEQPGPVIAWGALWFVGFSASAMVLAASGPMPAVRGDYSTLAARFGPFAVIIIATFLVIWALNTVAVFRAALQPDRARFFYVQIGADELRLAVMTAIAFALILVFGGVPAFLLLTLATPIMQILPDQAKAFALLGSTATICIDAWISVRLSLIAVETFAEGRFHLTAYWPLTRGRFWYLFFVYVVCFVLIVVLFAVLGVATAVLGAVVRVVGMPHGADLVRRIALLGLAGVYAGLVSAFWAVSTTLVCASQAHSFRAITGIQRRRASGF